MNRQAQRLIKRFESASKHRMARGNAKEAPTQPLFHYTKEKAFYSIIQSETFWFSSIYYMDDDAELSFGFGECQALLKAALERGDLAKPFLEPLVDDKDFEKIKALFEFYSASFGQKDVGEQWRDYADVGAGVAIGFAPEFFALQNPSDPTPEEKVFLGKVVYGNSDVRHRHASVIDSAISYVKQAYREGLILKPEDEVAFFKELAAQMYVEVLWNSVTSKAEKWSPQCETRLLALNNLKNPKLKIHNADVKPRVELPQTALKPNLVEVMLGPNAEGDLEGRIKSFLAENDLGHVSVTAATAKVPKEGSTEAITA